MVFGRKKPIEQIDTKVDKVEVGEPGDTKVEEKPKEGYTSTGFSPGEAEMCAYLNIIVQQNNEIIELLKKATAE